MTWYKIRNAVEGDSSRAEINIFEQIGKDWWDDSGVTAKEFIDDVNALGDVSEITLNINSPGGSLYDGLTMYNFLKAHSAVIVVNVMGMAASSASVLAMSADKGKLFMPANTILMIHDPETYAGFGNAEVFRKAASTLDTVKSGIVGVYVERSGLSEDEVWDLMKDETYLTAEKAIELGLADTKGDDVQISNSHDSSKFKMQAQHQALEISNAQKDSQIVGLTEKLEAATNEIALLRNPEDLVKADPKVVIAACEAANFKNLSVPFLERGLSEEQVSSQLAQADNIRSIFVAASLSNCVEAVVSESDPIDMMRVAVTEVLASYDSDIHGQYSPGSGVSDGCALNSAAIYAKRK